MSTYDDSLLAARFAALAPEPLAGNWGDVLRRAGAAQEDRRPLERARTHQGRRRFLVVLAAAILVVVVGTAAAFGIRAFVLDRGFIGLPPVGATPSSPESGELVLSYKGVSATLAEAGGIGPTVRVRVYADGRIIWSREGTIPEGANKLSSGYLEQRLTPEGVELLRSELVATGLFDRRLSLLHSHADVSFWGVLRVRDGDRFVDLEWWHNPNGTDEKIVGFTTATPEELSALRRVDALVTDPASVLPSSAWADRQIRAYVPSHYGVCLSTSPPKDASELLSLLPTRAADVLRGKSLSRVVGDIVEAREAGRIVVLGQEVSYCVKLTTEEAREVAEPLSGIDPDPRSNQNQTALAYQLAEPVDKLNPTSIGFEPYLPDGPR